MSVQLWLGNSGSGKTYNLFNYITKEAVNNPDTNYIMIVPEQFTLQTQHDLVRINPKRGILNIDVLSIQRLALRVFEEVGSGCKRGDVIDDMGKNLILRHLAENYSDKLTALKGNMTKLGYISEVKSVISEFMQYGIGMKEISEMINKADGHKALQSKLMDIQVLYNAFLEDIKNRYITNEEMLDKACEAVSKSRNLEKSVIAFDGFTGFTPVQYNFVEALMKKCKETHITVVIDSNDKEYNICKNEQELFYLSKTTINKIKERAKSAEQKVKPDILLKKYRPDESGHFWTDFAPCDESNLYGEKSATAECETGMKSNVNNLAEPDKCCNMRSTELVNREMLYHFEKNLFRPGAEKFSLEKYGVTKEEFDKKTSAISVFDGITPQNEIEETAKRIQLMVRDEALFYSDIAVITGDVDTYSKVCQRVFDRFGIPYFIDKTLPVLLNPLVEYVRAVLSIVSDNYSYDSMFRYLKSSLADNDIISRDIVDRLENYVLSQGIKGRSKWKSQFTRLSGRMEGQELLDLESVRRLIIEPFVNFEEEIEYAPNKKYKVRELCTALYTFVHNEDICSKIGHMSQELKEQESYKYKEMDQIYDKFIDLLEQLEKILGDERITIKEFSELMDAGFEEIRTGILPVSHDYVLVGDITRTRLSAVKVLFFVGVNDGIIPMSLGSSGILSDMEREIVLSSVDNIELAPTSRMKAYTQQFYLYMMLTKPSRHLFISFSRMSEDGKAVNPSYFIKTITSMYPQITIKHPDRSLGSDVTNLENGCLALSGAIQGYIEHKKLNHDYMDFEELFAFYAEKPEYNNRLRELLDASFNRGHYRKSDAIGKAVSNALYKDNLTGSVTRLETYAGCAYRHFLQYGMQLNEREQLEVKASDLGTVFHDVIMHFSKLSKEKGIDWFEVSDEDKKKLIDSAIERCANEEKYTAIYDSERTRYYLARIGRIVRRTLDTLEYQLRQGSFEPNRFEFAFSEDSDIDCINIALSENEMLHLRGRIDRVDRDETDDKIYVKVIDYKSGRQSFDIAAVYKGLQLQLAMYLNAADEIIRNEEAAKALKEARPAKQIVPGAMLYYSIDDPLIETSEELSSEDVNSKINGLLKMNGLVNSDKDIFTRIDRKLEIAGKSDVIPVALKKDGDFQSYASVVSTEDFEVISEYVNDKIREMCQEMYGGNIKIAPVSSTEDNTEACTYCNYKNICHINIMENDDETEAAPVKQDGKLNNNIYYVNKMREHLGQFQTENMEAPQGMDVSFNESAKNANGREKE